MKRLNLKHWRDVFFTKLILLTLATPALAYDLPFVKRTEDLSTSIAGPFLTAAGTIMFVVTCLMAAFGEWGEGFKKVIQIVFWLSIALAGAGVVAWMKTGS